MKSKHERSLAKRVIQTWNSMTRRFSYMSYKPDYITELDRLPNYEEIYKLWVEKSPVNDSGDLIRLFFLHLQIEDLLKRNVPGEFAELGVYRGTTAKLFRALAPEKKLKLFDTFEGFDSQDLSKEHTSSEAKEGSYLASLEDVKSYLGEDNIEYIIGRFPDSLKNYKDECQFSLVHLDADLYAPQIEGLKFFYPRVSSGGIIIVHDCNNVYKGSRKALDEFIQDKPETPIFIPDKSGTAVIAKV